MDRIFFVIPLPAGTQGAARLDRVYVDCPPFVIPAKAGTQGPCVQRLGLAPLNAGGQVGLVILGPGVRRDDEENVVSVKTRPPSRR